MAKKAEPKALTIVSLEVENVKRLRAVKITPDGALVQITGRNGQGKTSVLDSIWWGLTGTGNVQSRPIRAGEEQARIRLDLGEIIVTRKFGLTKDEKVTSSLDVRSAEGARYDKPQTLLDSMLGALTLDPLEFERADKKKQFEIVKGLVSGIDFDAYNKADKADREKRLLIGRELTTLIGARDKIDAELGDKVLPPRVDEEDLIDEIERAMTRNQFLKQQAERHIQDVGRAAAMRGEIQAISDKIAELNKQIADLERLVVSRAADAAALEKIIAEREEQPVEAPIDIEALRAKQRERREQNALHDKADQRDKLTEEIEMKMEIREALTSDIEQRAADKRKAISECRLPVDGLDFGEDEILLNDQPFEQASDAERLRASVALAMAANPEIRVIRIRDGSRLDGDAREWLEALCEERGFQVWMERVTDGEPVGIVIEDGQVRK